MAQKIFVQHVVDILNKQMCEPSWLNYAQKEIKRHGMELEG
jgi:hypothetical protein